MRRDVFQAIADPIRRDIIELLAAETLTINSIAEKFEISRPAISKHLKILKECEIIDYKKRAENDFVLFVRKIYCRPFCGLSNTMCCGRINWILLIAI